MATTPSFTIGYWRPWNPDSNFINSWLDYNKDVSLQKYNGEIISEAVSKLNTDQVQAINKLGNVISGDLKIISSELKALRNKMDSLIQIEISNKLILENIADSLKIPDSEKSRLFHIKNAVKFLRNVTKDASFYSDALTAFEKAKEMNNSDFFTLYNIASIKLYDNDNLDIQSSLNHFLLAAKYSKIFEDEYSEFSEKDSEINEILGLSENVNNQFLYDFQALTGSLPGYCYLQASLCCYILGNDQDALEFSKKAKEHGAPLSSFYIGKYASRLGLTDLCLENVKKSLSEDPAIYKKIIGEYDFILNEKVVDYLSQYIKDVNLNFSKLKLTYKQYLQPNIFDVTNVIDRSVVVNTYNDISESEILHINGRFKYLKNNISDLEDELAGIEQTLESFVDKIHYQINRWAEANAAVACYSGGEWYIMIIIVFLVISFVLSFFILSLHLIEDLTTAIVLCFICLLVSRTFYYKFDYSSKKRESEKQEDKLKRMRHDQTLFYEKRDKIKNLLEKEKEEFEFICKKISTYKIVVD